MNKKKFFVILYLLFSSLLFAQKGGAGSVNFPSLMASTKRFQNAVLDEIVFLTGIEPVYFVITAYDENERISVFFDSKSLDDNTYAREMVCCTAPYFVAESADKKSHISFSFAFFIADLQKCELISERLYRLYLDGTISQLAENYSIHKNIEFYSGSRRLNALTVFSVTLVIVLLLLIVGVVLWIILYSRKNAERKVQNVKAIDERLTKQLEKETVEKFQAQIIEPVTGLFSSYYIKEQIKKEISQFDVFGRNFSVAIFTTKETSDIETIKKIAEIIKENLNSGVVTSYKGDGVFIALFSNKESDDIGIFVDLVVEKIYQANISISSEIFDFKGQMTFLGKLGLDERNKNSDSEN
ncbi:MAG: hypothetical protein K6A43_12030 [Treponema sp.]|nr:hypothetical protein [Treponema sp.]